MAAIWLSRKRLTCTGLLDMPIGLRSGQQAVAASPVSRVEIIITAMGRDASSAGGQLTRERNAWLVLVGIANSGLTPIRAGDFAAPLAFAFPGREIRGAQIQGSLAPCIRGRRSERRLPQLPSVLADADRVELGGEFHLNRKEEFVLIVALISKSPGVRAQIRQEGAFGRGTITIRPSASSVLAAKPANWRPS